MVKQKAVYKLNISEIIKQNRINEFFEACETRKLQLFEEKYIHTHASIDDIIKEHGHDFFINMLTKRRKQLKEYRNPSVSELATTIQGRSIANDVFYTPLPLAKRHIRLLYWLTKYNNDLVWYDPFYGSGNYYNNFPHVKKKYWSEIALGRDFFNVSNKKIDVICSNPPYSILTLVLKHSIKLKPLFISYLVGFHNFTTSRVRLMNQNGYGLVYIYKCNVSTWFSTSTILTFKRGAKNIKGMFFDTIRYKN